MPGFQELCSLWEEEDSQAPSARNARETRICSMKRNQMIAKIQIEYPKLRPDLDADEMRDARLAFCGEVLGLSRPPKSLTRLTDRDLGYVLDAIARARKTHVPAAIVRGAPLTSEGQAP